VVLAGSLKAIQVVRGKHGWQFGRHEEVDEPSIARWHPCEFAHPEHKSQPLAEQDVAASCQPPLAGIATAFVHAVSLNKRISVIAGLHVVVAAFETFKYMYSA
jgi:hypothetical protein